MPDYSKQRRDTTMKWLNGFFFFVCVSTCAETNIALCQPVMFIIWGPIANAEDCRMHEIKYIASISISNHISIPKETRWQRMQRAWCLGRRRTKKENLKNKAWKVFVLLLHVKHQGRGIDHLLCENVFTTWMSTTVDEAHATARSGMMKILMIGDESAIRSLFDNWTRIGVRKDIMSILAISVNSPFEVKTLHSNDNTSCNFDFLIVAYVHWRTIREYLITNSVERYSAMDHRSFLVAKHHLRGYASANHLSVPRILIALNSMEDTQVSRLEGEALARECGCNLFEVWIETISTLGLTCLVLRLVFWQFCGVKHGDRRIKQIISGQEDANNNPWKIISFCCTSVKD